MLNLARQIIVIQISHSIYEQSQAFVSHHLITQFHRQKILLLVHFHDFVIVASD